MENLKREDECCCCSSIEDLFSLLEPYNFEENVEIYSTMIAECFQIELSSYIEECDRHLYLICKNCVFRLRDASMFRSQIQIAYDRLQGRCKKDIGVISSEHSDFIETKEHILQCGFSECDNKGYNSEDPSSNENVLKPIKINSQKVDDDTIENVSVVSTNGEHSKILFCNICNVTFTNLDAKQEHKKFHLKSNANTCKYCNKEFKTSYLLLRHERMHFDIKYFICNYCERIFRNKKSLKEHILNHMGVRNIKCDLCDKFYVSKRSLSFHKRDCHSARTCNICGKTLNSKRAFKDHAVIHSGVKNEKCQICDKTFATKRGLSNHKKIHFYTSKMFKKNEEINVL